MITSTYHRSSSSSSSSLLMSSSVANLSAAARSYTRLDEMLSISSNKSTGCLNEEKQHNEEATMEDEDEDEDSGVFLNYRPYRSSQFYRRRRCSLLVSMDSCRMETIFEEKGEE
ncbi:hypothetical protein INT45_000154 [Circinella minor]|uniref:Uncharacterized protein n=1 Tax=Circinella minor TaxID=1195481 RepID=A0A8H7VRA1_9FUNG|nr:hypothetical protein INT45_000154 [Circinella minor]